MFSYYFAMLRSIGLPELIVLILIPIPVLLGLTYVFVKVVKAAWKN